MSSPMSDNKNTTVALKVKILRSRKFQRVICLECGKEFADLLLSLMITPVGTILKLLGEGDVVKSDYNGLFNLYDTMKQLEVSAFTVDRTSLIDPVIYDRYSNNILRLPTAKREKCINTRCENNTQFRGQICDDCEAVNFNACRSVQERHIEYTDVELCLTHFNDQTYRLGAVNCTSCGLSVSHHLVVVRRKGVQTSSEQKTTFSWDGAISGRGFVEKNIRFMVKEDLSIIKSSALSALALIKSMKSDFSDLDMKVVDVGKKESLLLIRAAMISEKPLTDVFEAFF